MAYNLERIKLLMDTAALLRDHGARYQNILTTIDKELLAINDPAMERPRAIPTVAAQGEAGGPVIERRLEDE